MFHCGPDCPKLPETQNPFCPNPITSICVHILWYPLSSTIQYNMEKSSVKKESNSNINTRITKNQEWKEKRNFLYSLRDSPAAKIMPAWGENLDFIDEIIDKGSLISISI